MKNTPKKPEIEPSPTPIVIPPATPEILPPDKNEPEKIIPEITPSPNPEINPIKEKK